VRFRNDSVANAGDDAFKTLATRNADTIDKAALLLFCDCGSFEGLDAHTVTVPAGRFDFEVVPRREDAGVGKLNARPG